MDRILRDLIRRIEVSRYFNPGEGVLLAVSGGPDSVFLLHLFSAFRNVSDIHPLVACVHHGLRREADRELELVRDLADREGMTFHSGRFAAVRGHMSEESMRRERYRLLGAIARENSCSAIVTGHTLDDQAETVLMRLVRGAGLAGLCGMRPVSPLSEDPGLRIVRPLLQTSRKQIAGFLEQKGIRFCQDRSNLSPVFFRNRIRHAVLPLLERENPQIREQLAKMSLLLQDDYDFIRRTAEQAARRVCASRKGGIAVYRKRFSALDISVRRGVIILALDRLGCPLHAARFVEQVRQFVERGRGGMDTAGWPVRMDVVGNVVFVSRRVGTGPARKGTHVSGKKPGSFCFPISAGGTSVFPEIGVRLDMDRVPVTPGIFSNRDPWTVFIHPRRLRGPLFLRNARAGDRFRPLGMAHSKRISRVFIDRKVDRGTRWTVPLLVCGSEIVWVVGTQVAEPFRVTPDCRQAIRFRAARIDPDARNR